MKYSPRTVPAQAHLCNCITVINRKILIRAWDLAFGSRVDVADLNRPCVLCAASCPLKSLISLSTALSKVLVRLNSRIGNWSSWETVQHKMKSYFPINTSEARTAPKRKAKTHVNPQTRKRNWQLQSYTNCSAEEVVLMLLLWCCSKQVYFEYNQSFLSQLKIHYVTKKYLSTFHSVCDLIQGIVWVKMKSIIIFFSAISSASLARKTFIAISLVHLKYLKLVNFPLELFIVQSTGKVW